MNSHVGSSDQGWTQSWQMDSQQVKRVLKGTLHLDTEIVKEQWCCGRLTNGKGVTEADQASVCMYVPDLYVPDLCKPCHAPKIQLNNPSPLPPTTPWPGQSTTGQLLTTCPFYHTARGGRKTEQKEQINRWMTKKMWSHLCLHHSRALRPQHFDSLEHVDHTLVAHPFQHDGQCDEHACTTHSRTEKHKRHIASLLCQYLLKLRKKTALNLETL